MEEFTIPPPEFGQESGGMNYDGMMAPTAHAAWILKLIQVQLSKADIPAGMKRVIMDDMEVYVNNASMTNITQGQVREFLGGFKELFMKYRIFQFRKKYWKELNVVETRIRELFVMNLNKSINGFQPELVFIQKHDYDVRQTNQTQNQPTRKFFGNRRQKTTAGEESP